MRSSGVGTWPPSMPWARPARWPTPPREAALDSGPVECSVRDGACRGASGRRRGPPRLRSRHGGARGRRPARRRRRRDERDAQRPGQVEQGRHDECAERRAHRRRAARAAAPPPRVEGAGRGAPRCARRRPPSAPAARLAAGFLVATVPSSSRPPPPARRQGSARSQAADPVLEQVQPGVAGLLGVELGRAQGPILDRGDELRTVTRPRDRGARPWRRRRWAPASTAARHTSGRSRSARARRRRTGATRRRPRPPTSPCAARRRPGAARPCPATPRSPSSGCSDGSVEPSKSTCMPTHTPSTGRPPLMRRPMMRGPCAAARPAMQAWKLPTPGTKSPSHSRARRGSDVSVTVAPTRSRARTAERTLPLP